MRHFLSFTSIGFYVFVVFASHAGQVAAAQDPMAVPKLSVNQQKAYPGGHDEDDLKVQEGLKTPTQLVDRRSIELRVLKTYFKKSDTELVAPSKAEEEEHPPTENQ